MVFGGFQHLYWDLVPVSSAPCILLVTSSLSSFSFISYRLCSFICISSRLSALPSLPLLSFQPPSCFPFFFPPPPYFLLFSSCHCTHTHKHTHTLDIRINSLDFSAHNLTVNRKWLTWISILRYEHGARAAFVYTIMLLKAFTLTNCLRSKEEKKKREIQLSEMWEGEEKRWIWSTDDSMYLSKHPHVLKKKNCQSVCWTQSTDSGRLSRLRGGWQANIININILLWMNCMYSCLLLWPRPSIDGWCTLYWQLLSYRRT